MFRMKPISVAVHAAVGMAAAAAALPALASSDDEMVEEIVVTGSRLARSNTVTSSPVAQLDSEAIELSGVTRIEDALLQMPQVFLDQDSGQAIESEGTATMQLRNLGVSRTLVLVDGKRLPINSPISDESGPDLNFIPAALVERVDILTGGASAAYGSDAVAGVVNFIMKDDFEGVKLDYQLSGYRHENNGRITALRSAEHPANFPYATGTATDGDTYDMTFMVGGNINDGRGNITAYATYRDIDAVTQAERDYSACALDDGRSACGGSATSAFGTFFANDAFNVVGNEFLEFDDATRYNFAPPSYYQRPDERYTLGAFAHYDVTDQVTVFTQLMFMDDRTIAQFAPAGFFFDYGVDIYCNENPYLSAQQIDALDCASEADDIVNSVYIGRRNVEGGPRFGDLRHTTFRGVFGVKGDINETWNYEVSYQYAEVDMRNYNGNYLDTAKIGLALDPVLSDPLDPNSEVVCRVALTDPGTDCVPWNIWQQGGVTPEATAYLSLPYFERGTTDQTVFTAFARGNLGDYGLQLPWADDGVDVVVGYEKRQENLVYTPDAAAQAGAIGGLAAARVPVDGGYKVDDYFFEASVPLVQGRNLVQDLALEFGYRYSDYDTGASTDTYKIATSWSINDQVMLRGSFQRAVRAGNIVELFQPVNGSLFDLSDDPCADVVLVGGASGSGVSGQGFTFDECARSGVTLASWDAGGPLSSPAEQYNTVTGGSADIKPEESDTYSGGIVLQPDFLEGLTVAVDYYDIEVKDAIFQINPETTLGECIANNEFCDKVHRNPNLGGVGQARDTLWLGNASPTNGIDAFYENIGFFRVKGIDVEASYRFDVGGFGSVALTNVLGYIDSWEQEEYPGAGAESCEGVYAGSCGTPTPEYRNRFTAAWTTPWNVVAQLTWRHVSDVDQIESNSPVDIDALDYVDLAAYWTATDWVTVRAGINNLFDIDPPIVDNGVSARNNGNTYPGGYDHLGQYWFLGASVQF